MHATQGDASRQVRQRGSSPNAVPADSRARLAVLPRSRAEEGPGESSRQRTTPDDIEEMRRMRHAGSTYAQIALRFNLHYSTVMYHLDNLKCDVTRWAWTMTPEQMRTAMVMRAHGAGYAEIGRALHLNRATVRATLTSTVAQQDFNRWKAEHSQPPPPPSSAA